MRYTRTGIIAVLVAVEVFIAGTIVAVAGGFSGQPGAFRSASYQPVSLAPIDAGSQPHVVVRDPDSHLVITASNDGQVHVTDATRVAGWLWGAAPKHVQMQRTPDGVVIERPSAPRTLIFGFESSRTEIALPPNATLDIQQAGGTDLSDLTGVIAVHSNDGHIEAHNIRSSQLSFSSADGHIYLDDVSADRIDAATADGSIHATALHTGGGRLHTDDGSIRLTFADASNLTVHARTADGSIRVNGVRQRAESPADYTLGDGTGSLDVSTSDGSIRINTNGAR